MRIELCCISHHRLRKFTLSLLYHIKWESLSNVFNIIIYSINKLLRLVTVVLLLSLVLCALVRRLNVGVLNQLR